jgi:hypothetical protein
LLMLPAPAAVEEAEEASGDLKRLLLLLRLLLRLLLPLPSAARTTPLSAACASMLLLPAPTAVEEASRDVERFCW